MAACQREKGVVGSGVLRDGKSAVLLLRGQLRTGKLGSKGTGEVVVRGNGRGRSTHEALGEAGREGIWTGCMGTCILGVNVPGCIRRHLGKRTAGRGSCEGEGPLKGLESTRGALGVLGDRGTGVCIMAQVAPSARTWHRNGFNGSSGGGEGEGLMLSRKRGI